MPMHPTQATLAALLVVLVLYVSSGPVPHASAQGGPIDLGPNTEYVGPHLWAMLQRHAEDEVVPDLVVVEIGYHTDLEVDPPLEEFIKSAGGEKVAEYTWRIPTENALLVIQRPDLVYMAQPPEATEGDADPYPTMDGTLNDIVAAYAGGITGENAVRYALFVREDSVVLEMQAPDAATVKRIRRWLTRRSVHVPPESDFAAFSDDFPSALVPASLLTALADAFPSTYLSVSTHAGEGLPLDRAQWPAETLKFEESVVAQFLPPQQGEAIPTPMPTPTVTPLAVSPALNVRFDTDGDGLIEVEFLEQLDAIRHDLDGNGIPEATAKDEYAAAYPVYGEEVVCNDNCKGYELARPLDFAAAGSYASGAVSAEWNEGQGWRAIGDSRRPFAATFNGNGHAVSNLHITPKSQADGSSVHGLGLFGSVGASGVIRETGLLNASVAGGDFVGPLAGANRGTVSHSYATGSVSGYGCVGGLVGSNAFGVISSSYATAGVSGGYKYLGGLAGCNNGGTIIASHATGSVSGDTRVGGLVGDNSGSVIASYATGGVSGDTRVGGLAGNNSGSVIAGYATGSVRGQKYVGGLVGRNDDGSISASYSVSEVTGGHYIGGLAGGNGGTVTYSYAVGKVSSDGSIDAPLQYIGGLAGYNPGIVDSGLWDTETSGQQVGIGIEIGEGRSSDTFGKTTAELQSPAGYTGPYRGWDVSLFFEGAENTPDYSLRDFWDFGTSGQYPALKVDFDGDGTATWREFGNQRGDAPGPAPAPVVDNCVEIMTAAVVSGAWSSNCASGSRSGSYARFYTFTLNEPSEVIIDLESGDTGTYLYLLQGAGRAGEVLEDYGSARRSAQIGHTLGTGAYTVEVTTYDSGQTGSFTLTVNWLATPPTPPPPPDPPATVLPPTPTPTHVPTSTPAPAEPTNVSAPTPSLPPTPMPTRVPTSTPEPVEPTGTSAPMATAIAAQGPTPAPDSGGACSYPDEDTPMGAAAISMFLLVAPLGMIGGLKLRARRRRDR